MIQKQKNINLKSLFYIFIEKYRNIDIHLSNGFVEGTNGKLKMIKRTTYDRCS